MKMSSRFIISIYLYFSIIFILVSLQWIVNSPELVEDFITGPLVFDVLIQAASVYGDYVGFTSDVHMSTRFSQVNIACHIPMLHIANSHTFLFAGVMMGCLTFFLGKVDEV